MSEIPFGKNRFSKKKTTQNASSSRLQPPLPTPSQILPAHDPETLPKQNKRTGEAEVNKAAQKKPRVEDEAPPVGHAITAFSKIVSENFTDDDVTHWSRRDESKAAAAYKLAMGEAFFHGFKLLSAKDARFAALEKSLMKQKEATSATREQLKDLQKQYDADLKASQGKVSKLQAALDQSIEAARKAEEDHLNALSSKDMEVEALTASKDKELSDAFNEGFLTYLENFLADDPSYDWQKCFPPSTSAYMEKFVIDHAAAIAEAKTDLEAKIAAEAEAAKNVEAEKQEKIAASPSNAAV